MYETISGGVTAAQGFSAGATRCGIKASSQKDDTAVIFSEVPCTAAAVYTKNRVKASPIQVTATIWQTEPHRRSSSTRARQCLRARRHGECPARGSSLCQAAGYPG